MEKSFSDSYAAAGVDVTAGYKSVELIKSHVKRTNIAGVLGGIGGFGGMFEIPANEYKNPVLVSGTDGVGTKIKLAFLMDKHDTIGIDCVAMCVNDVACSSALFRRASGGLSSRLCVAQRANRYCGTAAAAHLVPLHKGRPTMHLQPSPAAISTC